MVAEQSKPAEEVFCLHTNVDTAPGNCCKVKLRQWNSLMLLILLKTSERIGFYYCSVSFIPLDCDCVTVCVRKNAGCNRTADGVKIKDPLHGADIINCKKCTYNKL